MKPSGIEWIGDIPDDWEVRRLKGLGEQTIGLTYSPQDITDNSGTLVLRSSNIQNGKLVLDRDDNVYVSIDVENKILKDEDILICSRNGSRNLVGKTAFVITYGEKLSYGAFTTIFRSKYNKFLFYVFNAGVFEYHLASYNTSTINQLTTSMLNEIRVPFPPVKTQQKIADYLDEKCGEIDATIAKQKESIEKLKAYKQSLISETVTKGLDKSAPLKPSGIDYLGDIPNDWEVIKTKFLFNVYGGSTPKVNVPEYWGDKITWITPGELGDDIKIVLNSKRMLSEKGLNSCGATLVSKGSIIISNRAPIGQVCLAGSELCTNQGCKSLVAKIKLSCLFFYYFFKVQSEVLNMLGNGTTFMELSTSDLLNFKIPCPTIKEQQKIADYLDSKCSQIDKYITEKQNIIQKLDAYKKSLIFECVTGKHKI